MEKLISSVILTNHITAATLKKSSPVLFVIFSAFLISSCSKSSEEKIRIAQVTCSIIESTVVMESATRVKEVNEARTELDLPPYLDGDVIIKESIKHGECISLILNDNYKEKIALAQFKVKQEIEQQNLEQERLEQEMLAKAEEARLFKSVIKHGGDIYSRNCAKCHKDNGEGDSSISIFPAIKDYDVLLNDINAHLKSLLNGPIHESNLQLPKSDTAAVITYLRNTWGNDTGELVKESDLDLDYFAEALKAMEERIQKELLTYENKRKLPPEKYGEEIYNGACAACHAAGVLGAPKSKNSADWTPRINNKGFSGLLKSAISGINAMPPMGACGNCNEDDISAAIKYMSGIDN